MKKLFLFTLMILTACAPAQTQVTVTSEVTVTLPPPMVVDTPTLVPSPTFTFTPTPAGYTLVQLANMSKEDKIAAAPTIEVARERIPTGVAWNIESQAVLGERTVVYYDEGGRQRAAYDLLTGNMYDGVSIYEYAEGEKPLTVFFMNDSEALKEIPEKYLIKGQEERLSEAMFAVLVINGSYPSKVNKAMLEDNARYGLGSVEAQWKFYNEVLKPDFIAALKDGSALKKGITVEVQTIKGELPTFVVVRGRDDSKPGGRNGDLYLWTATGYDSNTGTFSIAITPSADFYRTIVPIMIGGELAGLRGLIADGIGGIAGYGAGGDFTKVIAQILTGQIDISSPMNDSKWGDRDGKFDLPRDYPGLPDIYYQQIIN